MGWRSRIGGGSSCGCGGWSGCRWPEVEEWVGAQVERVARLGECCLMVDATGVGRPVVDHLMGSGLRCRMRAVMVTGGQTERQEGAFDYVPKTDLMAGLQMLFEYGELKIARTLRHVDALKKALSDMRVKVTPAGGGA